MEAQALPKITLVTPVLNGGGNLRSTLESIVQQQYPNLEYIVVDGGSTDNSLEIIAEYKAYVTHLLQGKDRTMYDAVAKGFDRGTGEIFCWLNSDDIFTPGILLKIGKLFAAHPDWQMIYGDDALWKQGWLLANRPQKPVQLPELLQGHIIPQASTFFRREAYLAIGGLERVKLRLAADYQLWARLAARYELHFLPEQASVFRIRHNQLSGNWKAYIAEVHTAGEQVARQLPADYLQKARPQQKQRARQARAILRQRRFFYPVDNERLNWPPVSQPPPQPMNLCRCPLCGEAPQRLLFSTPDTCYGDRHLWQIYYCESCQCAFRFPHADPQLLQDMRRLPEGADFVDLPDVPAGVYSPFRTFGAIGRMRYTLLGKFCHQTPADLVNEDLAPLHFAKDAPLLVLEDWGQKRASEFLAGLGYTQLTWGDIAQPLDPAVRVQGIVLGQSLQHVEKPLEFLAGLKNHLLPGGKIVLSIPNLDSAHLEQFGPCWCAWHAPFHAFMVGRHGLAELARRAGYQVENLRSHTLARWLYTSEQLTLRGLYSHSLGNFARVDQNLWQQACGAARAARIWHDPRGRGDCLFATLLPL